MNNWINVDKELPKTGKKVFASFILDRVGLRRTICAHYIPRYTIESDCEESYDEYREEDDTYYLCEGWYENIENWGDFSAVYVCEGVVTHWQPLMEDPE